MFVFTFLCDAVFNPFVALACHIFTGGKPAQAFHASIFYFSHSVKQEEEEKG